MKKFSILLISIITICLILFFLPIFKVFSFTETKKENPQLIYVLIKNEDSFSFRFTHSIHLTDVIEKYKIVESNKIKLVSMEYEDVAVGMPANAEEGQSLRYEDGKYILSYDNKIIDNFTLYVGDIDLDLFFYYDNSAYNLKKQLVRGKAYLFEVKKISLYQLTKGDVMKNE